MDELVMSDFFRAAELMTNGWKLSNIKLINDDFYPRSPEVWIRLVPRKYSIFKNKRTEPENRVYLFSKIKIKAPDTYLFRFSDTNMVIDPDDL